MLSCALRLSGLGSLTRPLAALDIFVSLACSSRLYTSVNASRAKLEKAEKDVLKANGAMEFLSTSDTCIGNGLLMHTAYIKPRSTPDKLPSESGAMRSVAGEVQNKRHHQDNKSGINDDGGHDDELSLVIMPGYASGVGNFARNVRDFHDADLKGGVYIVDWLGTGLSSRPLFTARSVEDAEDFFVRALEEWRKRHKLKKMILLGHSLGGYLSFAYAERYPERVEHLIMASPAGLVPMPAGWEEKVRKKLPSHFHCLLTTVTFAWTHGVTPGSFVRWLGPFGPGFVRKAVTARFGANSPPTGRRTGDFAEGTSPPKDLEALSEYYYHNLILRGSGENALNKLLLPGAWGLRPLIGRMAGLEAKGVTKISFIYGDRDWMDSRHAVKVKEAHSHMELPVKIVDRAGHQLHMMNPRGFVDVVTQLWKR